LKNFPSRKKRIPLQGIDWVGYETLIAFIIRTNVLEIEGDFVEIGTFLGGGAYKLAKFLEENESLKKLYVIDVFDPTFDLTKNTDGNTMATLYQSALKNYPGKTQEEIFFEVTKNCTNIVVLKSNSKNVHLPIEHVSFGFIDGDHDPSYVENDFYLLWNKLTSGGVLAFDDYETNLPQTTTKIKEMIYKHASKIRGLHHDKHKHLLFIIKK
jgi:predicted O-methyltransferase YrrM